MIYFGPSSKNHDYTLRCNTFTPYTYRSASNYISVSAGDAPSYNKHNIINRSLSS